MQKLISLTITLALTLAADSAFGAENTTQNTKAPATTHESEKDIACLAEFAKEISESKLAAAKKSEEGTTYTIGTFKVFAKEIPLVQGKDIWCHIQPVKFEYFDKGSNGYSKGDWFEYTFNFRNSDVVEVRHYRETVEAEQVHAEQLVHDNSLWLNLNHDSFWSQRTSQQHHRRLAVIIVQMEENK